MVHKSCRDHLFEQLREHRSQRDGPLTVTAVNRAATTPASTSAFGEPPTNGATNGSARRAPSSARKAATASRESYGEIEPPPRSRAREAQLDIGSLGALEHEVSARSRTSESDERERTRSPSLLRGKRAASSPRVTE